MAKRLKAFHIENTVFEGSDAGWDIYLFLDGSPTGMLVWFFYDYGGSLGNIEGDPAELDLDDVFSDKEISKLWKGDFRKLTPPWGVRRRVLTDAHWEMVGWQCKPIDIVKQKIGLVAA